MSGRGYSDENKMKHVICSYGGVTGYCRKPSAPSRSSIYRWRRNFASGAFEPKRRKK